MRIVIEYRYLVIIYQLGNSFMKYYIITMKLVDKKSEIDGSEIYCGM